MGMEIAAAFVITAEIVAKRQIHQKALEMAKGLAREGDLALPILRALCEAYGLPIGSYGHVLGYLGPLSLGPLWHPVHTGEGRIARLGISSPY